MTSPVEFGQNSLDAVRAAYRTPDRLAARAAIYAYQEPWVDLAGVVVGELQSVAEGGIVADLGCGPGHYLRSLGERYGSLRLLGLDLSPGMISAVDGSLVARVVGSIAELPLATDSLDAALAMHVLYHLDDPAAALREIRRVIRPGGVLMASTNDDLPSGLWRLFTDSGLDRAPVSAHWPLAHAAQSLTAAGFADVRQHTYEYTLRVPRADIVLSYLDSCRATMPDISDARWTAIRERCALTATERIERDGVMRTVDRVGVVSGRKA